MFSHTNIDLKVFCKFVLPVHIIDASLIQLSQTT